jgi:hypothetical protein
VKLIEGDRDCDGAYSLHIAARLRIILMPTVVNVHWHAQAFEVLLKSVWSPMAVLKLPVVLL